jgi:hypothetical protein
VFVVLCAMPCVVHVTTNELQGKAKKLYLLSLAKASGSSGEMKRLTPGFGCDPVGKLRTESSCLSSNRFISSEQLSKRRIVVTNQFTQKFLTGSTHSQLLNGAQYPRDFSDIGLFYVSRLLVEGAL